MTEEAVVDEVTARRLLTRDRARLTEILRVLRAENLDEEPEEESFGELSPIDQHQADVGSEVFEREKELSLMAGVRSDLADVVDALARLDRGDYGTCESCGRPIPDERLQVVPATRFCSDHQSFWEAGHLTLAPAPGLLPVERGVSIDEVVRLAAVLGFDLLPRDDELVEELVLGPEEAAMHRAPGGSGRGEPMTEEEIELAEARAVEEEALAGSEGREEDVGWRHDVEAVTSEEEGLDRRRRPRRRSSEGSQG